MIAGQSDPLFDDWSTILREPNKLVAQAWKTIAARASSLVEDWPVAAGMVRARLLGTHGAHGLRFVSLFQEDDEPETTDAEMATRRAIDSAIRRRDHRIDAGGTLSRRRFDRALDWSAIVLGNGWAVRVLQDDGHRWRLIHPFRVRNPRGATNSETFQDGVELDAQGRPVAVWVDTARLSELYLPTSEPVRIPWTTEDGTPNVVHRVGYTIPGAIHGVSMFAPLMLPARMLQGVSEAYVAAKRVQASIPLLFEVDDPLKAREAYAGTRLASLAIPKGSAVTFPSWRFDGADWQIFDDTQIRDICSSWGIPSELVLGDHSAKSGASARSLWQQYYQQADDWQADFAEEASRPMNEAILREDQAAGLLPGLSADWDRNLAGIYRGPPRIMPDPLKEAQAAAEWDKLGRSRSSSFGDMGWDYREETMRKSQDHEQEEAQGVEDQAAPAAPAAEPMEQEDTTADDAEDMAEDGEEAAPGDAQAIRRHSKGHDMRASEVATIIKAMQAGAQAPAPVQIIHRQEIGAEAAALMGAAIAAGMPQQVAPVVNVAPAAVTVEAAQVTVPAPVVNVTVPAQAAPVVMAQATVPPIHVHVPEAKRRRQRAVEQDDGSVILEDL